MLDLLNTYKFNVDEAEVAIADADAVHHGPCLEVKRQERLGFKRNLISIGKIDRAKYHIYIYNDIMKVYKNNSKTCSLHGILDDGLYRVKSPVQYKPEMKPKSIDINYSGTKDCEANSVRNYSVSVDMWHQRFGHMYTKGINILTGNDQVKGIQLPKKVDKTVCDNCEISKSTRASFKSEHKSVVKDPLELLHMDLWGPCRVPSLGGSHHLLCIVDDSTYYTWIFSLKRKSQTFDTYKNFHNRIERLSGYKIKTIRTDRRGEFTAGEFEDFLTSQGVTIQRTNSYSPEMNGVAERVNRTVLNSVRAMLLSSGLPKRLWAELAMTLIYLKNRYPHARLGNAIPYILFRKRPLSLGHLKVPGSLAYVHIPKPDRHSKLEPCAWKGVMIGYAMGTRGYRLWDPISNNVYESKHVKFDELRIYKDVVQTYVGDTPLDISDGRDTHFIPHDDSGDSDDDDTPPPLPQAQLPTRNYEAQSYTVFFSTVYFYAPGRRAPLHSRPELKEYCEQELRVKFNADDFNWVPTQEKPGYLTSDDDEATERPRYDEGGESSSTNGNGLNLNESDDAEAHIVSVYCASLKETQTFDEAMFSPQKAEWTAAMAEELDTLEQRDVFQIKPRPPHSHILLGRYF
uniref:Integrase catalytic domain-containing protein n=1 Tax=Strigamia maritima TaxID=126957 RepID=T1IUJ8_STRMM